MSSNQTMRVVFGDPVQEYIVGSSDLGMTIDLDKASFNLKNAMYEPEQFSALIYRMTRPKSSGVSICKWETCVFRCT